MATLAMACITAICAAAQRDAQDKTPKKTSHAAPNAADDGERLFKAHCGRCHNPPQELSPGEARTVLQHMRVRAMLSKQDEQAILNYIAP
jgi:mono/diheme cytochrome c family protein